MFVLKPKVLGTTHFKSSYSPKISWQVSQHRPGMLSIRSQTSESASWWPWSSIQRYLPAISSTSPLHFVEYMTYINHTHIYIDIYDIISNGAGGCCRCNFLTQLFFGFQREIQLHRTCWNQQYRSARPGCFGVGLVARFVLDVRAPNGCCLTVWLTFSWRPLKTFTKLDAWYLLKRTQKWYFRNESVVNRRCSKTSCWVITPRFWLNHEVMTSTLLSARHNTLDRGDLWFCIPAIWWGGPILWSCNSK